MWRTVLRSKCIVAILAGGILLLAFTTFSYAEGVSPNLDEARRLLNEDKATQSVALLQQKMQEFSGNAEFDYLLGLALYKSGKTGEAVFAFERVLMTTPGNVDARLMAAKISLERGANVAYTRELMQPLSKQQLNNEQEREKIRILAAIDSLTPGGALSMRGYLISGVGIDSNVTGGPEQSELIIPGLSPQTNPPSPPKPTQLGTAASEQDRIGIIETGLSLQKALAENVWLTGAGNIHLNYNSTRADVNYGYSNLNLGLLTLKGGELFGAAVLGQVYQVANITYRNSLGARVNWTHAVNDSVSLSSYLQQLSFVFPTSSIDNTTRRIGGVSIQSTIGDNATFQFGAYGGNEVAQDETKPQFSFHLWGASLGGSLAFNKELSLSVSAAYESRTHDAQDPLYFVDRTDDMLTARSALDYKLSSNWHLMPTYTYSQNVSNTALYAYSRNIFMLQLQWEFDNE
ncbi:MAG: surface lipoprotein assembly modifier [Gallionellaceae bacterium]